MSARRYCSGQRGRTENERSVDADAMRSAPAIAIIAPLSVQYFGSGKNTRPPRRSTASTKRARNSRFAPTPPASTSVDSPVSPSAWIDFATSTSTTAAWNACAMSALLASESFAGSPPSLGGGASLQRNGRLEA